MISSEELKSIASQVRRDILRMVTGAGCGHPGGALSSADILTALYFSVMDIDPSMWPRTGRGQDAFILSAGHLSALYYSVLARRGYFPVADLAGFRSFGSPLQGHPCVEHGLPGVFQPSGSLGQGLSAAAGMALAKRLDGDTHKVYALVGDGESEEGQIWEAAMFAAAQKLDNLVAMTDWNRQQIDGCVDDVAGLGDLEAKWKAFGWETIVADGHDMDAILGAFARAAEVKGRPVMILFRTEMGHGVDFMAGTCKWHGKAPSKEQCEAALAQVEETLGDY